MRSNLLKKALSQGRAVLGCSIMFPSPELVEMLAAVGFDWILIDCEHGSMSMESVEEMARAAQACGITPIARPRKNDPHDIMLLMDRGVMGVQVPYVNTVEDAKAAVAAVKFGPGNARGLAVGTRPHGYGFHGSQEEFTALSNKETMVIVQIETAESVANLQHILKVPDIDVFFIGPSDLSQSMGFPGNTQEPRVLKAIASCVHQIRQAGKIPGMPTGMENAPTVINSGVKYVHGHLPWIVGYGARAYLRACLAGQNQNRVTAA